MFIPIIKINRNEENKGFLLPIMIKRRVRSGLISTKTFITTLNLDL